MKTITEGAEREAAKKIEKRMNAAKSSADKSITFFTDEYAFLSNFYPVEVEYEGIIYPSSEHAYQAAKTSDTKIRQNIADMKTPNDAKKAGRRVALRPDFELIKNEIMYDIVYNKFFQNPALAELLIRTEDGYLVEGNYWHDNYWGRCTCDKCKTRRKSNSNMLGAILERVRADLIEEYEKVNHYKQDLHRREILKGYIIIEENLSEFMTIIQESDDIEEIIRNFQEKFGLDEAQANAIAMMRISRFSKTEKEKIHTELEEVEKRIAQIDAQKISQSPFNAVFTDSLFIVEN